MVKLVTNVPSGNLVPHGNEKNNKKTKLQIKQDVILANEDCFMTFCGQGKGKQQCMLCGGAGWFIWLYEHHKDISGAFLKPTEERRQRVSQLEM